MSEKYVIGVDLGGTKIATGLTDKDGTVINRIEIPTSPTEGVDAVFRRVEGTIEAMLRTENIEESQVIGIGVGCPGPVDPDTGLVHFAPNLGWKNVPLVGYVRERFKAIPSFLENDANAAALGELLFGAGRGKKHLLYMTVSTGIGGGIIVDGRVYSGARFSAGEVGHIVVQPYDGPLCGCGNRGCLEALASGTGMANRVREALNNGRQSTMLAAVNGDLTKIDVPLIDRHADAGDELAREILESAWHFLGIGVVSLLHILDPETVVIGGGISRLGPKLFDPLRNFVRQHAIPVMKDVPIVLSELGGDVGLVGAAAVAWQQLDD